MWCGEQRSSPVVIFTSGKRPFPEEKGGVITHFHLGKSFLDKIIINWIKIYPADGWVEANNSPKPKRKVRTGIMTQANSHSNAEAVVNHDNMQYSSNYSVNVLT